VSVNGLATLYSGWMSQYDATRAGLLTGATAEELTTPARLFQGTSQAWPRLSEKAINVFVFRCCTVSLDMDLPVW
jgi:hypothetical protein